MAKTEVFSVPSLRLEWQCDRDNGWRVIAWKPHASMAFTDRASLLKFIAWPPKTPTGDLIRGWLDALISSATLPAAAPDAMPTEPTATAPAPSRLSTAESPHQAAIALSPELLATGFGPECHLDEADPNYQTRTVI